LTLCFSSWGDVGWERRWWNILDGAVRRTGRVAQMVEHLPRMCKVLNLNPRATKMKERAIMRYCSWC
jgi:hypothetical protein